ncbi:MAG: DUF4105 domain-containing protein [Proteobacteria bacterium]|nr:DUF4105 domain-containing protein [Pseudomonadota bacterium]
MQTSLKFLWLAVAGAVVVGLVGWVGLLLWFTLPAGETIRTILAVGYGAVAAGGLLFSLGRRRFTPFLLLLVGGFVAALMWWSTIEPRNDRDWPLDVARLTSAEIDGDLVQLRNIRDFVYRTETDYTPRWYDKTVDLRKLDSLDLIAVHWMGDAIARTFLSFGFEGEQVAISIETRKQENEAYSALAGFFRRYELYYVVADEKDLIGLRTTYRDPNEDVYLYKVRIPKEKIRQLFLQYAVTVDGLSKQPAFYNTATTYWTTNIVTNVQAIAGEVPFSWKILFSGYFAELMYERGALDQSLPFAQLRQKSYINKRSQAATSAADYSRQIRQGLPGYANRP